MEMTLNKAVRIEKGWMGDDNLESALTYSLIGLLNIYRERFDVAIAAIEKGKSIRELRLGSYHRLVGASLMLLGIAYSDMGEYEKAIGRSSDALDLYSTRSEIDHFDVANALALLGTINARMSKYL